MFHRTQHNNPFLFTPRIQGMEFGDSGSGGAETTAAEEDVCGVNGGGPGDDLFVDELLDFSNGFSETEGTPEDPPENGSAGSGNDAPPPTDNFSLSAGDDFGSLHESELSVQGETLESLEWLSHFVEDPLPDYSLAGKFTPVPAANRSKPAPPEEKQQRFVIPGQTKARTKRARTGGRIRPGLSPSSSSSSSTTTPFSPPKKLKRNPAEGGGGAAALRRCTHCGVTKTPQWRAGPFGPKSLCNACGVRHKSGRLLPEYRPACSPTFSTELHSNNHRKVLEMRRKKEAETVETGGGSGSGSELLV